jgi:hypothetical protein
VDSVVTEATDYSPVMNREMTRLGSMRRFNCTYLVTIALSIQDTRRIHLQLLTDKKNQPK